MKNICITILDSWFSAFLAFILCFLILNFYIDRPYSIIISISLALPVFMLAYSKIKKTSSIKSADKLRKRQIANTTYSLQLMKRFDLLNLFEMAIARLSLSTIKRKNGVFIDSEKVGVFPIFSFDGITKTDVVKVFNSIPTGYKAYIFGEKISQDLADFIDRFNQRIEFIDQVKTYNFLEKTNCLPKEQDLIKNKKLFENGFIKSLFNKKRSKKFLIFGFLFILFSAFVPIKTYYVICGCIFLTFSLFCRLFG